MTTKLIEKNRGEILEAMVRKSPYSIKNLAKKLGVSRTTLYNKFKDKEVDYDFLLLVSQVVHYDLREELPDLSTKMILPVAQYNRYVYTIEKKYMDLLERYRRLFGLLTKITHQYGLDMVRKQIDDLVDSYVQFLLELMRFLLVVVCLYLPPFPTSCPF
eukprot:gene2984-3726_t